MYPDVAQTKAKEKNRIKWLYKTFRDTVIDGHMTIKRLNLTIDELCYKHPFPDKPFERENSREFILAVKHGDFKKMERLLQNDKFLVYQHDHV